MAAMVHHHRPTLKQTNKPFKSKHSTKSALKDIAKGKVNKQSPKAAHFGAQSNAAQLRANRKNTAKITQLKKRQELISSTKIFNGVDGTPRIVAVIPLTGDVSVGKASASLVESLDAGSELPAESGTWKVKAERFKTSIQFLHLPYHSLFAALDAAKVADYVIFVLSPSVEVDTWGDTLLRALQAQGLPEVVATCVDPGLDTANEVKTQVDAKGRVAILKSLTSFMNYFVPSLKRVYDLSASSDRANALRAICEGKPNDVRWRAGRPWVLAEATSWEANTDSDPLSTPKDGGKRRGRLQVTGVIRGAPLSANRLVHLPGHGDFQIERIVSAPLPRSGRGSDGRLESGMEVEPATLAEPTVNDADSLVSTNVPDEMMNEQTWPTEEEMRGDGADADGMTKSQRIPDAKKGTTPRRVKKVPKGWSEYQAAWIVEDEDENEDGDDLEDDLEAVEGEDVGMEDDGDDGKVSGKEGSEESDMEDLPDATSTSGREVAFEDLDMEEETRQLDEWRSRSRANEEAEDAEFPDEIDTPKDTPARTRFQRYRGLRSFRTSPWDPYENLPREYGRIFQFEDYKRTEANVKKRAEVEGYGVAPGTRVTITLRDVPENASHFDPNYPLSLFGLLEHEHKISVLNFSVQRNTEYDAPVRSKDPLILCYGPRRLNVNPVYSQLTRGGGKGANNVHKFERWLRHGVTSVASIYAPITFGNQPCMLLRETEDAQAPELVAMGSFLNTDTTRIVAKRIVLTGHPFKLHKKTATVRYMFFNPDDVHYFAPVQLHTKYGRTGHIRESLGTHGYFKAHFDRPITQMDTVCMSLYKRVYPRWATMWTGNATTASGIDGRKEVIDENAMEE